MHALALVVIPPDGDPHDHVTQALAPFDEEISRDGWWDGWQIGGRFTGLLDEHYDPRTDPRNIETCTTCGGTGQRDWSMCRDVTPEWIAQYNGCNACSGVGSRLAWPTLWVDHPGDVVAVPAALDYAASHVDHPKGICFTIVAGEKVLHRETWDGDFVTDNKFERRVVDILERTDPTWRVALVDYHS